MEIWHVHPVEDERRHTLVTLQHPQRIGKGWPVCCCGCRPLHQEMENGNMVVVHNSYDGREAVEWANEILNQ